MITRFTPLLFSLSLIFGLGNTNAQTTLGPNDILVLWNLAETANGPGGPSANNDRVGLLTTRDLAIGTEINLSDSGSANGTTLQCTTEGEVTYTTTQFIPKFTVLDVYIFQANHANDYVVPAGNMSFVDDMALSTGGDQVFVYQGDRSAPTFVYSTFFDGTSWDASCSSSTTSVEPTTGGTFAFGASATSEFDNSWYNGPTTFTSVADAIAQVTNTANWTGENTNSGAGDTAADNLVANIMLPVELKSFEGRNQSNGNLLSWETYSELDNEGFDVEYSSNGREFTKVGFVEGNLTSTVINKYSFLHQTKIGNMHYYRLKQKDTDGKFEYSSTIVISSKNDQNINIYPNPAHNYVNISIEADKSEFVPYVLIDNMGKVVSQNTLDISRGVNTISLDLANFENGIYFLKFTNTAQTFKISKL